MRRSNQTVLNEYLSQGTTSANPAYTSTELNSKLGQYDQMAIQVVIDNVTGNGGFDLFVEHSADGRNFMAVKTGGQSDVSIAAGNLSTSHVNLAFGAHNGSTPLLGFVRLRMFFSNATTSAHVHVHVTQRDQS